MSVTLTEHIANVAAKGFDNASPTFVLNAINAARRLVVSERAWSFLETETASLVTTIGDPVVSLASLATTFAHPDAARLSVGTTVYPVEYLEPVEFKREQRIRATYSAFATCSDYWSYYAGSLRFTSTPTKVYTVALDYLAKVAPLVSGSDVDTIPDLYQDVIAWGAAKQLAFRTNDVSRSNMAAREYADALAKMVAADRRVQRQSRTTVRDVL